LNVYVSVGKLDAGLVERARREGIVLSLRQARILRLAEKTFNEWDVKRCGWSTTGREGASSSLVRGRMVEGSFEYDDEGDPYIEKHPNISLKTSYRRIDDEERRMIGWVEQVCAEYAESEGAPLQYFHQGDPRGCSLYIGAPSQYVHYRWVEDLSGDNYTTRGIHCRVTARGGVVI
jgi:hypothetical protein